MFGRLATGAQGPTRRGWLLCLFAIVSLAAAGYELAARIRRLGERNRALLLALIGAMEK